MTIAAGQTEVEESVASAYSKTRKDSERRERQPSAYLTVASGKGVLGSGQTDSKSITPRARMHANLPG